MATYPPGVELAVATIGPVTNFHGDSAKITVTVTPILRSTTGEALTHITWAATGQSLTPDPKQFNSDEATGVATFGLPFVDQTGWLDPAGNSYTNWAYQVKVNASIGRNSVGSWTKNFQPLSTQTEPIDLDLVADGPIGAPLEAPQAHVTSIAGLTGAVTKEQLEGLGLGFDRAVVDSKVDAHDLPGSSFLVKGLKVALGGDSITDGAGSSNVTVDSYRAYLGKILGSARAAIVDHGVPGESAAGLLARMPAIVAENPAAFVMMIGMNPSSSLEFYKREVTEILDITREARIPTLISLITPRGSDVAHQERINTYNLWLRHIASQRGLPIADAFTPLVDPATGYLRPEFDSDGVHPNPAGHLEIARAIAPALDLLLPPAPPLVTSAGAPGLLANPVMAASADGWSLSAGLPDGATGSHEVEAPAPGDGLASGNWLKMVVDATGATERANYVRHQDLTATPAEGDLLLITAQVKADEGSLPGTIQLVDGYTIKTIIGQTFGVEHPGTIRRIYSAPAFTSTPRIRYGVSADPGEITSAHIGAVQVYNLTALGLTELA